MSDNGTTLEADEVVRKEVNANGQVYLGRDLSGETVQVGYKKLDNPKYVCDECGDEFDLAEVAIFNRGSDDERVVCVDHLKPEDRIIE
jgi:hypothetical protein